MLSAISDIKWESNLASLSEDMRSSLEELAWDSFMQRKGRAGKFETFNVCWGGGKGWKGIVIWLRVLSVYQLCLFYPPFLVHEKDLRNCGEILCTVECHGWSGINWGKVHISPFKLIGCVWEGCTCLIELYQNLMWRGLLHRESF